MHGSNYTFSSDGITDSYSVAVEVVGCVITRNELALFPGQTQKDKATQHNSAASGGT